MLKNELREPVEGDVLWLVLKTGQLRRCEVEKITRREGLACSEATLRPYNQAGKKLRRFTIQLWDSPVRSMCPGLNIYWDFADASEYVWTKARARILGAKNSLARAKKFQEETDSGLQEWFDALATDYWTKKLPL